MSESYTIARLASAAGVHVETIRYYQRRQLVPEPPRPARGVRRYTEADAERLRFIKRAQAMGFTLSEISNLLSLRRRRSCRATRELAAAKLEVVDSRIRELRHLRKELAHLIADRDANTEETSCPVIERLTVQPGKGNGAPHVRLNVPPDSLTAQHGEEAGKGYDVERRLFQVRLDLLEHKPRKGHRRHHP